MEFNKRKSKILPLGSSGYYGFLHDRDQLLENSFAVKNTVFNKLNASQQCAQGHCCYLAPADS